MRYELPTPFFDAYNKQSNFVLDAGPCYLQLIPVSQDGMCNAGIGRSQVRLDTNNFAPRLGLAYQATNKTVIRVGSGVFYGRDEDYGISARLPSNPPWVSSATFTGTTAAPVFLLQNGFPANALALAASGYNANTTVYSQPFNFSTPYVEQWNLNVEQQLPGDWLAQIGYTEIRRPTNSSTRPTRIRHVPERRRRISSRRPYQGVSNITYYAPIVNSVYNALVAKLEKRFSKGLSVLASYTYGHSIDGDGQEHDTGDVTPQNVRDLAAERGSSNFDVRNRFVLSGFYILPFGKKPGVGNYLIRDWQFSGIFSAQNGQPFSATLSTDPSNTGTTARPNVIGNGNLPAGQRTPNDWFNTAAFAVPNCVCFGNAGRDILTGPGFVDTDLSIIRNFQINERFRVQFRAESFNLANHPNFGLPNAAIGNPAVGTITTVINPERQNQLALKLYF